MKQNILKRIIAASLLLATLISCIEWPGISASISVEAAEHVHTDACYTNVTHKHNEYCRDVCCHMTFRSASANGTYSRACSTCGTNTTQNSTYYTMQCSVTNSYYYFYGYECKTCGVETFSRSDIAIINGDSYTYDDMYHLNSTSYICGYNEGDVHTPSLHVHTGICAGDASNSACTNGCSKHSHYGSSSSGTGCYGGDYHPEESYYCGGTITYTQSSWDFVWSGTQSCPDCGGSDTCTYVVASMPWECSGHEGFSGYASGSNTMIFYNCNCGYESYSGTDNEGSTHGTYLHNSAYYDRDCGKDETTYYKNGVVCSLCNGTGKLLNYICGKDTAKRYDCDGNECSPVCDKVVTSLSPDEASQVIIAGTSPNLSATVTYLDGHTETVTCSIKQGTYSDSTYNTAQKVILTYGSYHTNASTTGPMEVEISVTIMGNFNLTVNANDAALGTVNPSGTAEVLCGSEVTVQATPGTGVRFDGWYNGNTRVSTANPYTFVMPGEDITYTAKFSKIGYYLYVMSANSAYGSAGNGPTGATYGSTSTWTATPKTGYVFDGWYSNTTGSLDGATWESSNNPYTFTMPAHNCYLLATFSPASMTVTFNANGGSVSTTSKTVYYNDVYGTLPNPTRSGYVFLGWAKSNGSLVDSSLVVTDYTNHTLTATWGELGVDSMTVIYDRYYEDFPKPSRPGYVFLGWFWDEIEGNGGANQAKDGCTETITATNIMNINGNLLHDGAKVVVKQTEEKTVHAKWTPKEYTLTFNANGGTCNTASKVVTYDKYYGTLPTATRTGKTFLGWTLIKDGDKCISESDLVQILDHRTVYAKWGADPTTVTVTFNPNGGTFSDGTTALKNVIYNYYNSNGNVNTYATLPTVTAKAGWAFNGWYYNGTKVTDTTQLLTAANHTLTAQYNMIGTSGGFTVYGYLNGASLPGVNGPPSSAGYFTYDVYIGDTQYDNRTSFASGGFVPGTSYNVTDIQPNPGYVFDKIENGKGTLEYNVSTTVRIYVNSASYPVELDANGGTSNSAYTGPVMVKYKLTDGNKVSSYKPSRTGYDFLGWTDINGTLVYDATGGYVPNTSYFNSSGAWILTNGVTLYAKWSPKTQTVTFNANGGTCPVASKTVTYDEVYGALPKSPDEVYRDGYTFTGWYTAITSSTRIEEDTVVKLTMNQTLYAQWKANDYTVALIQQGATTPGDTSVKATYGSSMPTPIILPIKQYIIEFNGNGGIVSGATSFTVSSTFNGYYTKGYGNGTQYYSSTGASVHVWDIADNAALYASWTDGTISLPNASRTGYIFEGWFADSLCTKEIGTYGDIYTPEAPITLYAKWTPVTETVTFDANGGIFQSAFTTTIVTYDSEYGMLPVVSRSGYKFIGWYTARNEGTLIKEDTIVKTATDHTLYAHWEANPVVLNINALYTYDAGCKEHESLVDNKGYTIATFDVYVNGTLVADNVNEFNKTLSFEDSYEIKDIQVNPGYQYNGPKVGYNFNGYTGKKLTGTFDMSNYDAVNGKVYLWLDFEPITYTETIHLNGGTAPEGAPSSYEKSFHQSWNTKIFVPSRLGYTFAGWWSAVSGGTNLYNTSGIQINDGTYWKDGYWHYPNNLTLYAQWTPNPYTITINGNKGSGSSTVTVPYPTVNLSFDDTNHHYNSTNHADYLKGNLATRPGYTLTGYYTLASGGIKLYENTGLIAGSGTVAYPGYESGYYFYQNRYKYAGNLTIYAQWNPITYTVSLDLNDPNAIPEATIGANSFTIVFDTKEHHYKGSNHSDYLASDLPNRYGYTFLGWYDSAEGGVKVYNADGTITKDGTYFDSTGRYVYPSNVTFYAHWKANTYTLTLDANKLNGTTNFGSTKVNVPYTTITMTYDSIVHKYNNINHSNYLTDNLATRIGYDFVGYYTAATGGTKIYNNLGALSANTIADNRSESKSGYYFYSGVWKVVGDLTLYAQWKAREYDITLDDRGATSTNHTGMVHMTFDKVGASITVPTKTGYTFHGYYTGIRGTGIQYYDENGACLKVWTGKWQSDADNMASVEDTTTLYAYWTQNDVADLYPGTQFTPSVTPMPTPTVDERNTISFILKNSSSEYPKITLSTDEYDVTVAVPSPEELDALVKSEKYQLKGVIKQVEGTEILKVQLTFPYRYQYEDYETEELYLSEVKYYSCVIDVPKEYLYWIVTSSDVYLPYGITITNDAFNGTKTHTITWDRETEANVDYTINQYVHDKHVWSPEWDTLSDTDITLNGERTMTLAYDDCIYQLLPHNSDAEFKSYFNYNENVPVFILPGVIKDSDTTSAIEARVATELKNTIYMIAKDSAFADSTQLKVRSDNLVIDGHTVLDHRVNSTGKGVIYNAAVINALSNSVPLLEYKPTMTLPLEATTKNGTYTSTAKVLYEHLSDVNKSIETVSNNITTIKLHTPVLVHPGAENFAHTLVNNDGTYDEDYNITIDEYVEYLDVNLLDIMQGAHITATGYGDNDYMTTETGKYPYKYLMLYSEVSMYLDMNKDTETLPAGAKNTSDDVFFEKQTAILFAKDNNGWYVLDSSKTKHYVDLSNMRFYVLAIDCTSDFVLTYGSLAINGDFVTEVYNYDYSSLFESLKSTSAAMENANLLPNAYFAYKDVPYEVHYKYITFKWYDAEEDVAVANKDKFFDQDKLVLKQGYEGYFYATQIEGFQGTIEVKPMFSLVDKDGNLIDENIMVFYSEYKEGLLEDIIETKGLTPDDDIVNKEVMSNWLKLDNILNPNVSQNWTYNKVIVYQNSMHKRVVYDVEMEALHGIYKLPNGIKVLRISDIPDVSAYGYTQEQFKNSYIIRNEVMNSDLNVPYYTDGYLQIALSLRVIYPNGTDLITHGSIPYIYLYYPLSVDGNDGLYADQNEVPLTELGKDGDYEFDHVGTQGQN